MRKFCSMMIALAMLCGCGGPGQSGATAREVERTVLVRVLGVDVSQSRVVGTTVTAVSGAQEGVAPVVLQGDGATVAVASAQMRKEGAGLVSATHVGQILLGQDAAQRSVAETLEYVVRERELGLNANVWVVKDGRSETVIQESEDIVQGLERLADGGGTVEVPLMTSVEELVAGLAEHSGGVVPAIVWDGTGVRTDSYAVLSRDALVGYASEEAAFGVELLSDVGVERVVEYSEPSAATMALALRQVGLKICPVFEGERLVAVAVTCQISARVEEKRGEADMEWHRVAAEESVCKSVRSALELGQRLCTDYHNIQGRLALKAPAQKRTIKEQWDACYPTLEWRITVEVAYE